MKNKVFGIHALISSDADLKALTSELAQLSELDVNTLVLEINYSFEFTSHPELRNETCVTREGAQAFRKACDAFDIHVIPQFQCVGHQSWSKTTFPLLTQYPEFDETPGQFPENEGIYCRSWCPQHPAVNPIIFALMDELIEAFDADALHVGMDEIFLLGSEHCPRCKEHDPAELFALAVKDMHAHLVDERGVDMLLWADRLLDADETGYGEWEAAANGTAPAIDLIPKDIILCDWHYEVMDAYPSVQLFVDKGFRVIPGGWRDVKAAKLFIKAAQAVDSLLNLGYLATTWGAVKPGQMHTFPALQAATIAYSDDTPATKALKQRSLDLQSTITKVSESVYCACGYSPANIGMIVGDDGIVIIDTGMFPAHAQAVISEFRKITNLPVAAIILTHGHGDHTGGVPVFLKEGAKDAEIPVYARTPFNTEGGHFQRGGIKINKLRGARQAGFRLPPNKRINNGVARAFYPNKDRNVFIGEPVQPTETFGPGRKTIEVAGITLDMVAAPGETADQLYVWFPAEKVVFTGDNFYRSWPNLYAIRGTGYRDVQAWIECLDAMLAEGPEHVVPGHTLPLIGKEETTDVLQSYRDGIAYIFQATIEGINQGMTPNELVHSVKLPQELASKDHLREFYGNVQWGIRAIFSGYLGWYDGNPTHLFSLPPAEEAANMAKLAGGVDALMTNAQQALANGEAQWCAQVCDHLIALNPDAPEPKLLKAKALEKLAENLITATGRNYYLTVAQELRIKAGA